MLRSALTPNFSFIHCLTHKHERTPTALHHCCIISNKRQGGTLRSQPCWDAASLTPISCKHTHTHNTPLPECYLSQNKNRPNAIEDWNNKSKMIASCEVRLLLWTWRVAGFSFCGKEVFMPSDILNHPADMIFFVLDLLIWIVQRLDWEVGRRIK